MLNMLNKLNMLNMINMLNMLICWDQYAQYACPDLDCPIVAVGWYPNGFRSVQDSDACLEPFVQLLFISISRGGAANGLQSCEAGLAWVAGLPPPPPMEFEIGMHIR